MSASQFVVDNIISVLGGTGVVVTGLSTYLGKLLADRSLMREKASLDRELQYVKNTHTKELKLIEKELKLELSKKDQFHQISKSTYEKIFETKIYLYTGLLDLKVKFYAFCNESHVTEVDDQTYDFYNLFSECRRSIESNKLYISEELSKKFDSWRDKAAPYLKEANLEGYRAHEWAPGSPDDYQNIIDAQSPVHAKMIMETMSEMEAIFEQVDIDVAKIRHKIDNPEH